MSLYAYKNGKYVYLSMSLCVLLWVVVASRLTSHLLTRGRRGGVDIRPTFQGGLVHGLPVFFLRRFTTTEWYHIRIKVVVMMMVMMIFSIVS